MKLNKSNLRSLVGKGLLIGAIALGARGYYDVGESDYLRLPLSGREYLDRELKEDVMEIVNEQERIFGIKRDHAPIVSYRPSTLIKMQLMLFGLPRGFFEPLTKRIWIDVLQTRDKRRETIAHELGHDFMAPKFSDLGYLIRLHEGIAVYIERKTMGKDTCPSKEGYRAEYSYYVDNCNLVKPILDKNFQEGVKVLVKNSPRRSDLKNPREYQRRVLGMTGEGK